MNARERRAQRLTDAFFAWDAWGRGWLRAPEPVEIEPPLVFPPWHRVRQVHDDTRRPHWLRRLFLNEAHDELLSAPAVEVAPAEPAVHLAEQALLVAPGSRFSPALTLSWIGALTALSSPFAFEILRAHGATELRLAYAPHEHALISSSLAAASPQTHSEPTSALAVAWRRAARRYTAGFEFGLARPFVVPLAAPSHDPAVRLLAALNELGEDEAALWQVLLQPVARNWHGALEAGVVSPTGHPILEDAPELARASAEKARYPLFAAAVRLLVSSEDADRPFEVGRAILGALASEQAGLKGSYHSNILLPLSDTDVEALEEDALRRVTRRLGMILSAGELAALVGLPREAYSHLGLRLYHDAPAPPRRDEGIAIGVSAGTPVRLSVQDRLRHVHMIGASGTGKSNLLLAMMERDLEEGRGLCLIDPHGDLADALLARIPTARLEDVAVLDPAASERIVGWNVLSAHNEEERELLASDLVGVFRRLSTSWGDQMTSVLANAVLALLASSEGGTLRELRRFLIDEVYRKTYLQRVRDPYLAAFWEHEFRLLVGRRPQTPILTRLDGFLRHRLVRDVLTVQEGAFDFRALLDERRVLVARLSQGRIGRDNAALIGSMLVSRLQQAALTRADTRVSARALFFVYIDEFHEVATPSMATLFSGIRKYGLGLTVAHQDLSQLRKADGELERAVLTNAGVRVAFRVGEEDARRLASGFSHFTAEDLVSLPTGEAIARLGGAQSDFALKTALVPEVEQAAAGRIRAEVEANSRARFAVLRPSEGRGDDPRPPQGRKQAASDARGARVEDPLSASEPPRRVTKSIPTRHPESEALRGLTPLPSAEYPEGRGGPKHRYLQSLIRQWAQDRGFKADLEVELPAGGRVDLVITPSAGIASAIAVEISVSTGGDHEIGNAERCVKASFAHVALVSTDQRFRAALHDRISAHPSLERGIVGVYAPDEFLAYLESLPQATSQVAGYAVTTRAAGSTEDAADRRARLNAVIASSLARLKREG